MVPAPDPTTVARPPSAFHCITAILIDGIHTDIVLHKFADKICLFVTQFERISNIFVARPSALHGSHVRSQHREIEHRFGTDTDEIQSAIRYLVTAIPALNEAPVDVVVTLGLKAINRGVLRQLEQSLVGLT